MRILRQFLLRRGGGTTAARLEHAARGVRAMTGVPQSAGPGQDPGAQPGARFRQHWFPATSMRSPATAVRRW
jgi:hypothetical protein